MTRRNRFNTTSTVQTARAPRRYESENFVV
jgi:hypothetical protein